MSVHRILSETSKCFHGILRNTSIWIKRRSFSLEAKENKVAVDGININYIKVGSGSKPVLCLPGVLEILQMYESKLSCDLYLLFLCDLYLYFFFVSGSIWSDFKPQVENLDRSKLTVIAWEPPGYGKSRPPNREFPHDFFHRDADWAFKFMKALSINKFSMLGWSDGGITAMILASKYPENVDKMVVWGSNAYIIEEEAKVYEKPPNKVTLHRNIKIHNSVSVLLNINFFPNSQLGSKKEIPIECKKHLPFRNFVKVNKLFIFVFCFSIFFFMVMFKKVKNLFSRFSHMMFPNILDNLIFLTLVDEFNKLLKITDHFKSA
ncbi:hypothetical protein L9F63_013421, partial [Diploptera punctata]